MSMTLRTECGQASQCCEELEERVAFAVDTIQPAPTASPLPPDSGLPPAQVISNDNLAGIYQQFVRDGLNTLNAPMSGNVFVVNPMSFFQFDVQGNLIATGPSSGVTQQSTTLSDLGVPFLILIDSGVTGFSFPSSSFSLAQLGTPIVDRSGGSFLLIYDGSASSSPVTSFQNFLQTFNQISSNSNLQVTSLAARELSEATMMPGQVSQDISTISPANRSLLFSGVTGQPYLPRVNARPQAAASTKQPVFVSGGGESMAPQISLNQITTTLSDSVDVALRSADRVITGKPTFPARVGYLRDALPLPVNAGISVLRALSNVTSSPRMGSSSEYRPGNTADDVGPAVSSIESKVAGESDSPIWNSIAAFFFYATWRVPAKLDRSSTRRDIRPDT